MASLAYHLHGQIGPRPSLSLSFRRHCRVTHGSAREARLPHRMTILVADLSIVYEH